MSEFEKEEARRAKAWRLWRLIDAENKSIEYAALIAAERERKERERLTREAAERRARLAAYEAARASAAKAPAQPTGRVERRSMTVYVGRASAPASSGRRVLSSTVTRYGGRPCRETLVEERGRRVIERTFIDE